MTSLVGVPGTRSKEEVAEESSRRDIRERRFKEPLRQSKGVF